jgi:hypothetical protein
VKTVKRQFEPAVVGIYPQKSIKGRLEQFLLDNIGKVATTQQMEQVAKDPETGRIPPRWHQRISELRTDDGYTIQTYRDLSSLGVGEYVLASNAKRKKAGRRIVCSPETWQEVLERANHKCEWNEDGAKCDLSDGMIDEIGGGTVRLTADHMQPHSLESKVDPLKASSWRALCGRHQVMKKNYWNSTTGKLNIEALLQSASVKEKRAALKFLQLYFKEHKSS